jgi:hypothetical protein
LLPSTTNQLQDAIGKAVDQLSNNTSRGGPQTAPAVVAVLVAGFSINSDSQDPVGLLVVDEPLVFDHPELHLVITTGVALLAAAKAAAEDPATAPVMQGLVMQAAAAVAPEDMVQVQCRQLKQPWKSGGFLTAR